MARRSKRALRSLRKKKNRRKDRRNGRMPFRPHGWFGKRRQKANRHHPGHRAETLEIRNQSRWRGWIAVVVVVVVTATATLPQPALADDHEPWRDEIDFEITEPVDGRRIFVEGLTVSGDRGRRNPESSHQHRPASEGIRRPGGELAPLLGLGHPRRGGAGPVLAPPARPGALIHLLLGGHPRPGRSADGGTRADPVPAPRGRGRAVHPQARIPRLDVRLRRGRGRVGVRDRHRAPGRASDGGRTRERHRDGPDGRRGDGDIGDGLRVHGSIDCERPFRPRRGDELSAQRARWRGDSRRDRRCGIGGKPPHPHSPR